MGNIRHGLMSETLNPARLGAAYSLHDIFDTLASTASFEDVLNKILATALREFQADQGSILLLDGDQTPMLKMLASHGMPREIVQRGYIPRAGSISEYVIREQRPMVLNEAPTSHHYETWSHSSNTPRSIHSAMIVPLVVRGRVLGTLNINRTKQPRKFTDEDLDICGIVASQAAIVIENRRLKEELFQKERLAAIGQTVAGISHCIKNILTGVKGGLAITESGIQGKQWSAVDEGFDILKRNSNTLSFLVLDLLDYSKERQPMRETFDVATMISMTLNTAQYKAAAQHVLLAAPNVCSASFYGDQDQIYRSLLNLVMNGIDACAEADRGTGNPPQVTVSAVVEPATNLPPASADAARAREWLVIEVVDNGIGIPQHLRDDIWDLFYSTKGSRGTGIGLAVTKKMIQEHGGQITVDSMENVGTRFTIYLPVTAPDDDARRGTPAR